MGVAQLLWRGRVFLDIGAACFETFPESASEVSFGILIVFLSNGENPKLIFEFSKFSIDSIKKNQFLISFTFGHTLEINKGYLKMVHKVTNVW